MRGVDGCGGSNVLIMSLKGGKGGKESCVEGLQLKKHLRSIDTMHSQSNYFLRGIAFSLRKLAPECLVCRNFTTSIKDLYNRLDYFILQSCSG